MTHVKLVCIIVIRYVQIRAGVYICKPTAAFLGIFALIASKGFTSSVCILSLFFHTSDSLINIHVRREERGIIGYSTIPD